VISFDDAPLIHSAATIRSELRQFIRACRSPRVRTMKQFAEDEIIIPTGPFANLRFRCHRQPMSEVFFDLVQTGNWERIFATGPSQGGKSLTCWITPALYHLFELKETIICMVPQMKMAHDKWTQDLLPVIQKTRYANLLPDKGAGSRGGDFDSITFKHGVTLKFMSGGGDDKNRASFTSRVVVITEVDGMDEAGGESRESDKISQVEARTNSYGANRRIYGECTLTTKQGRTYDEISKGTATKLLVQCRACGHKVSPEREDLIGWQDADNEIDARDRSAFACPDCGVVWSNEDRIEMHKSLSVIHRGQTIAEDGVTIEGDLPKTRTLGFRFNGFNNLLIKPGDLGIEEWLAARAVNSENAEKKLCQFFWALPYIPDKTDDIPLDALTLTTRTSSFRRGLIPPGTLYISAAIDLGKWLNHWVAIAWLDDGTCQIIDYGVIKVESDKLGVERATLKALREFLAIETYGWVNPDGTRRRADRVFVDSGFQTKEVYLFVAEAGRGRYWATDGRGQSARKQSTYTAPHAITNATPLIGEQYHVAVQEHGVMLLAMNADYWKSYAHRRFSTPLTQPGAMTFFAPELPNEHFPIAKQLVAEKKVEEFIPGKGTVSKWIKTHKANHFLDVVYMSCVAGNLAGYRVIEAMPTPYIELPSPAPIQPATESPFVRQPVRQSDPTATWLRSKK